MPEIIFTEEEKKLKWNELDYEALGKIVESVMVDQRLFSQKEPEESIKNSIFTVASMMLLLDVAKQANAEKVTQEIDGLTDGKVDYGKWKLTLEKVK